VPNDVLNDIRDRVPLVYIDAVPVRVDEEGKVTEVGMLLRQAADGSISRMVVSGRVMLNERIREALIRHLEKDLGPMASQEAVSDRVKREMTGGHDRLIRLALASVGQLP